MLKLIHAEGLMEPLREFGQRRPIFGTCAGAILVAAEVSHPAQESLGLVDIAVANGHIDETVRNIRGNVGYAQPAQMFENLGSGKFRDVASDIGGGFDQPKVGRGLAVGDIDRDGDLDMLLTTNNGSEGEADKGHDSFDEVDFHSYFNDYLDPGYKSPASEVIERPSFENFLSKPASLTDHLEWQLNLSVCPEEVRLAAESIIGNLNEDGYLTATLEEIAETGQHDPNDVTAALALAQQGLQVLLAHMSQPAGEMLVSAATEALHQKLALLGGDHPGAAPVRRVGLAGDQTSCDQFVDEKACRWL